MKMWTFHTYKLLMIIKSVKSLLLNLQLFMNLELF